MDNTAPATPRFIGITEAARRLGLTDRAVRNWITKGLSGKKLRATRGGESGMWLIEEKDLEAFLTTNEDPTDG